jgi:hypothetical protein
MAVIDRKRHISRLGQLLTLFDEAGSSDAVAMTDDEGWMRRTFDEGGWPIQVGLAANAFRKEMDRFGATHKWPQSNRM